MNDPTQLYCIRSKMNGKVITLVPQQGKNKEAKAQVWQFIGKPEQLFVLSRIESNKYLICNSQSKLALDLHKQKQSIHAKIIGYEHHGKKNQRWFLQQSQENGWFYLINEKSGYACEIEGGIDANGMNLVQNKNYGYLNQLWFFEPV